MAPKQPPKIILGCASWGSPSDPATKFQTPTEGLPILTTLLSFRHNTIDTSRRYPATAPGTSEEVLGQTLPLLPKGGGEIDIDTKTLSAPGCHKPDVLRKSIADSLSALGVKSVNSIYLHFPDRSVPLSDPVSTLSDAVRQGQAKRWGLSNYTVEDLGEILRLCDEHGWVKPGVFQDAYNPLNRKSEGIIELCHRNGLAFYAYSPGASGVLSPSSTRLQADNYIGNATRNLYSNTQMEAVIDRVRKEAELKGMNGHEIALRWTVWDGMLDGEEGDGVVLGCSSQRQLRESLEWVKKGPLDEELRELVGSIWESVKK
jgi:aflatoxin B1 aldehyde reductase